MPTTLAQPQQVSGQAGVRLGPDRTQVNPGRSRRYLEVELECGSQGPEPNVTGDDLALAVRIALALLRQFAGRYRRLDQRKAEVEVEMSAYAYRGE